MKEKRKYRRIYYTIRRKIFPDGIIRKTKESKQVIVEEKIQSKNIPTVNKKQNNVLKKKTKKKKDYLSTEVLRNIRKDVIELFKLFNITFKKTYYYTTENSQYVKFYKIDNKGKKTLADLLNKIHNLNHVVANEIRTNNKNEVSIFIYNKLGNIIEPKIEFKKEENMIKEKYWPLGVQKGKKEQELINLLRQEQGTTTLSKNIIEDFMPDEVIKKVIENDENYYPIAINIGGESRIKWKTTKI